MTPETALIWVQIGVSVFTLAGSAFGLGKLFGRFESFEIRQRETQASLDRELNKHDERITYLERMRAEAAAE